MVYTVIILIVHLLVVIKIIKMRGTCFKIKVILFNNDIKNSPETSGGISSKQTNVFIAFMSKCHKYRLTVEVRDDKDEDVSL